MHRTGLIVALFVAAGAGLVLGLFPEIDLWIAQAFYDAIDANDNLFTLSSSPTISALRKFGTWLEILLIASPVIAVIAKLFLPQTKMFISGRAAVFLILSYALGPGLLVNVALKDNWGRPRPGHITQFGGDQRFNAFWDFRGECQRNCSFVSGEAASAAWTMAPAALAPSSWRPLSLRRCAHVLHRYRFTARNSGCSFSVRHNLCRCINFPNCLADVRLDLPLAQHAAER